MSSARFVADGYRKSFGKKAVLRAASVWANDGCVTVLLGRNASGKSTLLRCATGVYGSAQGITKISGRLVTRPSVWRLARHDVLYWPDRGLLSGRRTLGWHFKLIGLTQHPADTPPASALVRSLSGGERTLAEMAWIEARLPSVLLADEPLAGLDPRVQAGVVERIRAIADAGAAVVVTGHDARQLLDLGDEVVWMAEGTTYALGTPQQAREHHQFRREYLGPSGAL